jgi:hypothetical protein
MSSVGPLRAPVDDPAVPPRPLPTLVPLIRDALASGAEQYRRAGLMLCEAKAQLQHGDWLPWLKENFELTRSSAARYMAMAAQPNVARVRHTHRRPREHQGKASLQSARVIRENKALAVELIQAGFKKLAYDAHPDRGGRTDAMQRLSRAREWALDMIATAHIENGWRL